MSPYFIRIVTVDSYMCTPIQGLDVVYSEFRGALINQVPILRVFGSTSTGQKICVHIHGVFPYFYIPYDGVQEVNSLMSQIATTIDKAVNISLNQASSNIQHVYKISLVSGIPMYGYHSKEHQFLKIYLYNPLLIRKVSNLLMNEATLGKIYQPHETHLTFPLQFMIDYNLHGMSNLILSEMKYRIDPSNVNSDIDPELFQPLTIHKLTVCELEGDGFAENIVNRQEIGSGNIAVNPGIAALWADERQRRRNKGETSQIEHLLELKRTNIEPTKSHCLYKQALLERLVILSTEKPAEDKINLSVYPAETPDNVNIKNASLVDVHIPSSKTSDDMTDSTSTLDETLLSIQPTDLNITMDSEAQNLLEILKDLGENVKDDLEDDSILSQVVKEDDEEDKYHDLSMPLESVMTPRKINMNKDDGGSDNELESDTNTTLIPQLDGECDSLEENCSTVYSNRGSSRKKWRMYIKKALYVKLINVDNTKKGKSLPSLDTDIEYSSEKNSFAFKIKNLTLPDNSNNSNICNTNYDNSKATKVESSKHSNMAVSDNALVKADLRSIKHSIVKDFECVSIKEQLKNNNKVPKKRYRKPLYIKTQEEIKILGTRIQKINKRDQLNRIIRKLHLKEHNICVLVSKKGKPKFNVISKSKLLSQCNAKKSVGPQNLTKIIVISNILIKTANYIDPDLHLTLKYPTGKCFLYSYNKNLYPTITDIPKALTETGNEKMLKGFINETNKALKEKACLVEYPLTGIKNRKLSSFDNFEEKVHSAVLHKDLPESLKISIVDLSDNFDKILLPRCKKTDLTSVVDRDLENNNCIDCLNENYKPFIYVNGTDNIETALNCSSHQQWKNEQFLQNKDRDKLIDADNKENVYIFSSKYLTNVNGHKLIQDVKKQSLKQLRETAESIKQQLERHIDYLKQPMHNKSASVLCDEERNKILNKFLVENATETYQKINTFFSNKELNNVDMMCLEKRNATNVCENSLWENTGVEAKKIALHNLRPKIMIDEEHRKNEYEINNDIFSKNLHDCYNLKKENLVKEKHSKLQGKTGTCNVSENKDTKVLSLGFKNHLENISDIKEVQKSCNAVPNPVLLTQATRCKVANNKKHTTLRDSRNNIITGNTNSSLNGELKVTDKIRRSPRINSPKYKQMKLNKQTADHIFWFDFDCACYPEDNFSSRAKRNNKEKQPRKLCHPSSSGKGTEEVSIMRSKISIENFSHNCISTPKLYLPLDGNKDSSSSEEESKSVKQKRSLRKYASGDYSRYSPLPISVGTTESSRNVEASANKRLVPLNTNTDSQEKKTSINQNKVQQAVCDISIKRRLSFSNISSLQTTIIEEKRVCNFTSKNQRDYIINKSNNNIEVNINQSNSPQDVDNFTVASTTIDKSKNCSLDDNSSEENSKDGIEKIEKHSVPKNVPLHSVNNNLNEEIEANSNSGPSDIFTSSDNEDDISKSFFKSPEVVSKLNAMLTAAEKYDKDTNYNAVEGTSKVLTPNDGQTNFQNNSFESSSFGLLTPYQRVVDDKDVHLNPIIEADEIKAADNPEGISDDLFSSGNSECKITVQENIKFVKNLPEQCHTALNLKFLIATPLKNAPSKEDVVKSLDKYKISHIKQEVPFYSNVEDVTGSVEIGYNVLKISSRTTVHLPEFESQSDSINNFRRLKLGNISSTLEWKKFNLKNLTLSFCKDKECIITPVKKPPSVQIVKNWIKEKSKKVPISDKKRIEKVKIFIPLSPGNNDDEDMDISLTVSPCTPTTPLSTASESAIHQTPKSSKTSLETIYKSPVLGHECKKRKKQLKDKLLPQSNIFSLRKSLLLSQDKSHLNPSCQITGVTVNNTYGFDKSIENLQEARALTEHQHLTLLVMEMHIRTRGDFKPNPEYDSIRAIFYSVLNDVPENHPKASKCKGVIAINNLPLSPGTSKMFILDGAGVDCDITYVDSEENLLNEFLRLIKYWDPDIIAGYEIEMLSWGYLIERAYVLGMNLKPLLSRTKENSLRWKDEEGQNELKIIGRIVLDVWRLMRHEIALQSYTFESIVYHILQKRVPQYSFKDLSFWWDHRSALYRHRTVRYYLFRVTIILELFDKLDLIGRTSELARLFGIQFYEVLSRGSQFRVESMMLRLAKPLNFIPVSPSVQQRANMKAPEYIPLILEPESKLYNDPVIVLDFQSLYPSIIIAYNYCFTTCVGRAECLGKNTPFEFGTSQLKVSKKRLEKLLKKDLLNFSPCGVSFVKKDVRDGILPRMLREILDTRLMVKNSMKENIDEQLLQKVLHNRQLGLKLIANVTYGYTAANFSGRMPAVEIADSVVSKGRETLQRAIEMVESTSEWGARVVYGDTDSLFVLVPGESKERAFEIGKKIAHAVTKSNPDPVKLKMEKVYQPCILQTKKRYVGYMYESPDQKEPEYDAKGIETVRRDGCPAVAKMLEKCLRLLFETKDISLVKKYTLRQFNKIIAGRASIQDLTFAKEYRGASGYRLGACVPALELARRWKAVDKRNEPRSKERVPYIIVSGPPGLPLIRLVRSPTDLHNDPSLRPNALYYITKVIIPPLNRCFNLIGADVNTWFNQMPRKQIQYLPNSVSPGKKSTISQYFSTTSCVACGEQTQTGICDKCSGKPQTTTIILMQKLKGWEEKCHNCNLICQSCCSSQTETKCVSLDCPVLYRRIQTNRDIQQATYVRQLLCSSEFLF